MGVMGDALCMIWIQFHPSKGDLAKVIVQGLCYCNSNAWLRHNGYQSGLIGITDQLILLERNSEVNRRTVTGPIHCTAALLT